MKRIALILVLALAACQPAPQPTLSTVAAQKIVLQAEVAYEAVLLTAVAYNNRPRCTTPRTVVTCSDPEVVGMLRKTNHNIMLAFDKARTIASVPGVTQDAVTAAVAAATIGIPAFQKILDTYK
jgi:hypothetical protein